MCVALQIAVSSNLFSIALTRTNLTWTNPPRRAGAVLKRHRAAIRSICICNYLFSQISHGFNVIPRILNNSYYAEHCGKLNKSDRITFPPLSYLLVRANRQFRPTKNILRKLSLGALGVSVVGTPSLEANEWRRMMVGIQKTTRTLTRSRAAGWKIGKLISPPGEVAGARKSCKCEIWLTDERARASNSRPRTYLRARCR